METVEFKSTEWNFAAERDGLKSNTVRLDDGGPRFAALRSGEAKRVRVVHASDPSRSFEWPISHVAVLEQAGGPDIFVVSWREGPARTPEAMAEVLEALAAQEPPGQRWMQCECGFHALPKCLREVAAALRKRDAMPEPHCRNDPSGAGDGWARYHCDACGKSGQINEAAAPAGFLEKPECPEGHPARRLGR